MIIIPKEMFENIIKIKLLFTTPLARLPQNLYRPPAPGIELTYSEFFIYFLLYCDYFREFSDRLELYEVFGIMDNFL